MYIPEAIYRREFDGHTIRMAFTDTTDWWKWADETGFLPVVYVDYQAYRWIPEHVWIVFGPDGAIWDLVIMPAWEYRRKL